MEPHLERAARDASALHGEYPCEAYLFAIDALAHCTNGSTPETALPSVGAPLFCWVAAERAIEHFGPLAAETLDFWGIRTKEDLNKLVIHLAEVRFFHKKYKAGMEGLSHATPLEHMLDHFYRP